MSEISPAAPAEGRASTRKRNLIIAASIVPVVALFALLGWALVQSGGNPGGFGVNRSFGEVAVERQPAPEFTKSDLNGSMVSLSGLRGKVVMLDFWSSWCPPCRQEAPALARVYREYEGRNVEFLGVAIWDNPGDVDRYAKDFDLPYPNLVDKSGRIAIDYGVTGIPEKFVIDTEGNLVRKFVGPVGQRELTLALDRALEAPASGTTPER